MTRRTLLRHSLVASLATSTACRERTTSQPSAVQACLRRIAADDQQGRALRAVLELNPEALAIKQRLLGEAARSALHGQPILIKDNLDTADAMHTTAGSLALLDSRPEQDAEVVKRLREAGLVIVGKTNLSEWANIRSPLSTSGWSARGGLTQNPRALGFSASGSSSGSAAAVAAGYTRLAIGTETSGSIISPASACGIVGLKPTLGLVSQRGIIPITHHQDTAGPMTASVLEAAQLLGVIADPEVCAAHGLSFAEFTASAKPERWVAALRGKRLGIVRHLAGEDRAVLAAFELALQQLRRAGAILIDPVELPNTEAASRAAWSAMLVELRVDLNAYLATRSGAVRSLAELIAFNQKHREQEMPHFGQELLERAEALGHPEAIAEAQAARALAKRLAGPEGFDVVLAQHQLDALLCPTNDPVHRIDLATGDSHNRNCSGPSATAGYPHLTVPMAEVEGKPVGLSFMGAAWSDAQLLALGMGFVTASSLAR